MWGTTSLGALVEYGPQLLPFPLCVSGGSLPPPSVASSSGDPRGLR